MTFDNGTNTRTSTTAEITEQSIRLIVQGVITLAVLGGWIYTAVMGNPSSSMFTAPVIAVIGFWFGQSITSTWFAAKQMAARTEVQKLQITATLASEPRNGGNDNAAQHN